MSGVVCPLLSSFIARQGIIAAAGIMFLVFTWLRKVYGAETRDLRTFAADVSKQGFQQAFGGLLMAAVGVALAHHNGLDALAWYGGEYPFEIVLTTIATRIFRRLSEQLARTGYDNGTWSDFWEPMLHMGRYGPSEAEPFKCGWYGVQLVQAVLLIGVPARLVSVGLIVLSMALPAAISPVHLVASAWYGASVGCATRTALTLYVVPLLGDAVQFVIIDLIQKGRHGGVGDRRHLLHTFPADGTSTTPPNDASQIRIS